MNEFSDFFSDPKVIIALLALIVSSCALIWTLINQSQQNQRWDRLNAPNPEIREIKMIRWKEITQDEAMKTQWGYDPLIYAKGEATGIFYLPYYLSIYNAATSQKITGTNPVYTIVEVENELKRIGFTGNAIVYKSFRPRFAIENMGKTVAQSISIKVDAKFPDKEWQSAFISNAKMNLSGNQTSTFYFDFEIPFGIENPEQLSFKVHLEWVDAGNVKSKMISAKWTTDDNLWSYEDLQ